MPNWAGPGERFRNIGEVCLDAHDLEGFGVDLVLLVAGIVTRQWGDGWADESHCQGLGYINIIGVAETSVQAGRTVVIENLDLVFMSMTKENGGDRCRRKTSNY